MTGENPTGDAGASIVERIEAKLSAPETTEANASTEQQESQQQEQQETEVEEPKGDETEKDEGPQYELSDIAKLLGVEETALDVDEDGTVKFKTKIDGTEGAAKLKDFLTSYQLKGHIDNRVRQISETEKSLTAKQQQFEEFAAREVQNFGLFVQAAQHSVMEEFQGVNWDALAKDDPIEHVAKKQAFESKAAKVQNLMGQLQEYNRRVSEAQQARETQQFMAEAQRLPSLIPEWANPQVAESERTATIKWLADKGVSQWAINGLKDAAMVAVLRNAMKSETVQSKAPEVEKKLRAAPRLIKPGSPQDSRQRNAEGVRDLKEQIRKTGGKGGSLEEYLLRTGKV